MERQKQRRKHNVCKTSRVEIPSAEELILIHEEAYYRALKRVEREKEMNPEDHIISDTWYGVLWYFLCFLIFPLKMKKRLNKKNRIYDNVLVFFISGLLMLAGCAVWTGGIGIYLYFIADIIRNGISLVKVMLVFAGMGISMLGSLFIVSGDVFSTEYDSGRIYAYSASLFALVSCIISIVALCVQLI